MGTAETEVVKRDSEETPLARCPFERLLRLSQDVVCFSFGEEKVAVQIALERVKEGELGYILDRYAFGFGEKRPGRAVRGSIARDRASRS